MSVRVDRASALVIAAMAAIGLYLTSRIDLAFTSNLNAFTGPRGYPGLILAAILALALVRAAKSLRRPPADAARAVRVPHDGTDRSAGRAKPASVYLSLCLFVLVFEPVGYLLAMPPLLVAVSMLGGARSWVLATLVSMLMALACLLAFRYGLDTVLPEGILGIDAIL